MNVRFYLSYDIKITLTSHFCRKSVTILSLCTHFVMDAITFHETLSTDLMHGVISLSDATSYDK